MNTEAILVGLLREGNVEAFNSIYLQYYKQLCAFALHYVDRPENEEVVQDVMTWLWENRETIMPHTSLKSFLYAAVKYKGINENTHRQIKEHVDRELSIRYTDRFDNPDCYENRELQHLLNETLRDMPAAFRTAFVMNRFRNATYKDIALKAGVSPKTVAYRISQSLKILRERLKDYLPEIF